MLSKLLARGLSMSVGDRQIHFDSVQDFEFALSGRNGFVPEKLSELASLTRDQLRHEARGIKAVEQSFVTILTKSLEQPGSIADLVRQIDLKVFSQDHGWRDIIKALNDLGHEADGYRQIALVKYMQYLTARQEVIKQAFRIKTEERNRVRDQIAAGTSPDVSQEHEIIGDSAFRETVIFDASLYDLQDRTEQNYTRLPKGEPVRVTLAVGASVDMLMSKHAFRFSNDAGGAPGQLHDEAGNEYQLVAGKNIVGRDSVCNVIIDSAYRDVSRLHLVIEPVTERTYVFTDLSSHGTFLPNWVLALHVASREAPEA